MSLSLLHRIVAHPLPVTVTEGTDIDAVRILSLAGHIKAVVPRPVRTLDGYAQPPATVLAVTPLGLSMVRRFPRR